MRAFFKLTIIEFKLLMRNFIYVFFAFVFPPLMLLLMGSIFGNQPTDFYGGYGSVDVMTPSYMGMVIAVSGIMGLPMQLADYRHRKVLKRFKATPLSSASILIPQFMVNFILCIIGILLLVIVGLIVFDLHFLGNMLLFAAMLIVSITAIFSMGFLIASVAPNSKAASAIAYLIYFPMLFLSGATMPLQMMPQAIKSISDFMPLTYCVRALTGAWTGQFGGLLFPLIILLSVTLVCVSVSIKVFRWE